MLRVNFVISAYTESYIFVIYISVLMPDPPQNTRILVETVTDTSAVVAWDAPENFNTTTDKYLVSWKKDKATLVQWESVSFVVSS